MAAIYKAFYSTVVIFCSPINFCLRSYRITTFFSWICAELEIKHKIKFATSMQLECNIEWLNTCHLTTIWDAHSRTVVLKHFCTSNPIIQYKLLSLKQRPFFLHFHANTFISLDVKKNKNKKSLHIKSPIPYLGSTL